MEECHMQFAKTSLGAVVRHLLVFVAMASVMPALSPFTGTALADCVATIPDENLRAALQEEGGGAHYRGSAW